MGLLEMYGHTQNSLENYGYLEYLRRMQAQQNSYPQHQLAIQNSCQSWGVITGDCSTVMKNNAVTSPILLNNNKNEVFDKKLLLLIDCEL